MKILPMSKVCSAVGKTLTGVLLAASMVSPAIAAVAFSVVPNTLFDTDGDGNNSIPFGGGGTCVGGRMHYQQVYDGSQIGGGSLDSIQFRLNSAEPGGTVTHDFTNVTIKVSSTKTTSATMSDVFADNVGPDETTFFQGNLSSSQLVMGTDPFPFTLVFPAETEFQFDGSLNNLLVDLTLDCHTGPAVFFDAASDSAFSRVYDGDETSLTASDTTINYGLVTAFIVSTPPPSPNATGLSGVWDIVGHNGEGYIVLVLESGSAVVYWFTYDAFGNQVWLIGVDSDGPLFNELNMEMFSTSGPSFGPGYNPADLLTPSWGDLNIAISGCGAGTATYISTVGAGSGTNNIAKNTPNIESNPCVF